MIAKYRPLFAPIAVIAAGIALAVVFWWIGQPRTTHRGSVLDNLPPRPPAPTATPIYVTTLPGITERQIRETPRVVNCTLRPGQEYETLRAVQHGGASAAPLTAATAGFTADTSPAV